MIHNNTVIVVLANMAQKYFIAFGIVLGASLMAGIYSILVLQPPAIAMKNIADNLKVWALIAALGGTIDPLRSLESHFYEGEISPFIEEILYILSAFLGSHMGQRLIQWICGEGTSP